MNVQVRVCKCAGHTELVVNYWDERPSPCTSGHGTGVFGTIVAPRSAL